MEEAGNRSAGVPPAVSGASRPRAGDVTIRSRGHLPLPHWETNGGTYFVTFRLAGSVPAELVRDLERRKRLPNKLPGDTRPSVKEVEAYLDRCDGTCHLNDPAVSQCVADAIQFLDGKDYRLIAWVVMPNHVHLLVTPDAGDGVAMMMQEVGRRYVRLFNDTHKRTGTLWEGRYKAAMIDSERYFLICQRYVEQNPLRAELVKNAADYSWSSHRNSAFGIRNSLVTPHEIFAALGRDDDERRAAYAALFAEPIPAREIEKIREATNKGWPLGSDEFIRGVEAALGRSARPAKRGRPARQSVVEANAPAAQEMLI